MRRLKNAIKFVNVASMDFKKLILVVGLFSVILPGCNNTFSSNAEVPKFLVGYWKIDEDNSIIASQIENDSQTIDWIARKDSIRGKTINLSADSYSLDGGKPVNLKNVGSNGFLHVFETVDFGSVIAVKYIGEGLIRVDWGVSQVEYYRK